jgi:hypothetical protein
MPHFVAIQLDTVISRADFCTGEKAEALLAEPHPLAQYRTFKPATS